jgi:Ca2+-transporting ATPase
LVGDIMIFEIGEIFSVDGILLEGASKIILLTKDLSIDESDMTGESDPIKKKVPKDYA